jgi:general secretion pathway protein N
MWNCAQIVRHCRLPGSSARPRSVARAATILLLTIFGSAAAVAAAAIDKTDARPEPAPANSAEQVPPNKTDDAHETAAGNPLWAIPIDVLAATEDRPLFSPTRRPPPVYAVASAESSAVQAPIEPERPPLLLIGTAAGDTTAIAVFLDQKTNSTLRLRSGQSYDGWVLGAVYKREVVLQKDHATVHLPLSTAGPAAPAAAASTQLAESGLERR